MLSTWLALLSAVSFGAADFAGGLASRRLGPKVLTLAAQTVVLVAASVAVAVTAAAAPTVSVVLWGGFAGIANAAGTFLLYRGLVSGSMGLVATLSGLATATIPALVGLALGDSLSAPAGVGIGLCVPAIALVSWQPTAAAGLRLGPGDASGLLAGIGFALGFIGLERAGTDHGAWPLVFMGLAAALVTAPAGIGDARRRRISFSRRTLVFVLPAGALGSLGLLAFLASTDEGQLAVVATLTAMYPAVTVILGRIVLKERWARSQAVGLVLAFAAAALVAFGASQ